MSSRSSDIFATLGGTLKKVTIECEELTLGDFIIRFFCKQFEQPSSGDEAKKTTHVCIILILDPKRLLAGHAKALAAMRQYRPDPANLAIPLLPTHIHKIPVANDYHLLSTAVKDDIVTCKSQAVAIVQFVLGCCTSTPQKYAFAAMAAGLKERQIDSKPAASDDEMMQTAHANHSSSSSTSSSSTSSSSSSRAANGASRKHPTPTVKPPSVAAPPVAAPVSVAAAASSSSSSSKRKRSQEPPKETKASKDVADKHKQDAQPVEEQPSKRGRASKSADKKASVVVDKSTPKTKSSSSASAKPASKTTTSRGRGRGRRGAKQQSQVETEATEATDASATQTSMDTSEEGNEQQETAATAQNCQDTSAKPAAPDPPSLSLDAEASQDTGEVAAADHESAAASDAQDGAQDANMDTAEAHAGVNAEEAQPEMSISEMETQPPMEEDAIVSTDDGSGEGQGPSDDAGSNGQEQEPGTEAEATTNGDPDATQSQGQDSMDLKHTHERETCAICEKEIDEKAEQVRVHGKIGCHQTCHKLVDHCMVQGCQIKIRFSQKTGKPEHLLLAPDTPKLARLKIRMASVCHKHKPDVTHACGWIMWRNYDGSQYCFNPKCAMKLPQGIFTVDDE